MSKLYYTHDNGGRPFKVELSTKKAIIYKHINLNEFDKTAIYSPKPIITITEISQKFIGLHGSSILLELKNGKYIFIGIEIFLFTPRSNIVKFKSNIGNSDVVYPYAIDNLGNIYLFIEDIIIYANNYDKECLKDPYNYYYNKNSKTNIKINKLKKKIYQSRLY